MKRYGNYTLVVLILLIVPVQAYATSEILYSARYYLPPGSKGTSHFHIYRIDAHGRHRRQLTFGQFDEGYPSWSEDGKRVEFIRQYPDGKLQSFYVPTAGGAVHQNSLQSGGDNGKQCVTKSPDGKHFLVETQSGEAIDDQSGNRTIIDSPIGVDLDNQGQSIWLNKSHLLRLQPQETSGPDEDFELTNDSYDIIGLDGKVKKHVKFTLTVPGHGRYFPGYCRFDHVEAYPPDNHYFLAVENWHNSTVGVDFGYYKVEASTGKTAFMTEGQFLQWSPDGRSYCIAPGMDVTPYAKWPSGNTRVVWSAPLSIVDTRTGQSRRVTPRLSHVIHADWR